ncbi:MAG: ABC transporter substrate-binding protein [Candidatus Hermodarchaeota archaeon]
MSKKHTQAGILLVLVICLIYSGLPIKAQTPEYLFQITIILPFSRPQSYAIASFTAGELLKIGIEAIVTLVGWDTLIPRVFESMSLDYNSGGFDIATIGRLNSIVPSSLYYYYHSSMKAPKGSNYFPVENDTLDTILEFVMNTTDFEARKEYIRQALDIIVWDIHPEVGACQEEVPFFILDNIEGFDPNRFPKVEEIYFSNGQSLGHGQTNELRIAIGIMPWHLDPTNWCSWDLLNLVFNPIFSQLVELDSDFKFLPGLLEKLPYPVAVKNNYIGENSSTDPDLATVWELKLRDNVYWHEGYGYRMNNATHRDILKFDANDIVWYYTKLIQNDFRRNEKYPYVFGTDPDKAFVKLDRYTLQLHLNNTYADLFTLLGIILPKHILEPTYDALGLGAGIRADGTSAPSLDQWNTDDYGQGKRTSGDLEHPATIGNGAYMYFPGEDAITETWSFTKWDHYFKDNDTSYWKELVQNRPDACVYVSLYTRETKLHPIQLLKRGDVDILGQYLVSRDEYARALSEPNIVAAKELSWYYATIGFNILNGAGSKLANRYVRLAISHMVPQQDIVDYLLHGFGQANFVPFPLQSPYYPKDLDPIEYNITKAFDYMEMAGYNMTAYKTQPPHFFPSFEAWTLMIALGGTGIIVIIQQYKKKNMN